MENDVKWAKFLFLDSILVVITGLLFAIDIPVFFPDIQADLINLYFNINYSKPVDNYISFLFGLSGAVMSGWGVMMAVLSYSLMQENNEHIWKSIVVGTVTWFILDSFISIYSSAYLNVVLNLVFLILLMIPILFHYKKF